MATALAQQLAHRKGLYPQERWAKGKHSLLFDYQRAADVSAETLLGIAQQGIEALCKVDRRFTPFTDSLFSRASLSITRDQLTKEENEQLDTNISAFLRVLVNQFLLPAAFQVLEYCIRRYQVHVYNVPDLLLCALPYHSTPEFARLLALLQLKGTSWEWLTPCQQTGAPPPRDLLVRRCVNDQAVIRDVCKGAESLGAPGFVSKTFLSAYAVLLCEVFTAAPAITEDLLTVLLPYLVAGLKSSATKEYRAATVIVLTQLLAKAQLGRDFLTAMVPEVICSAPDLGDYTAIMLLTHMATSQPELKTLSVKSMQLLVELCQTGQQLSDLQARGATLTPLLKLLLTSLAQTLPQNPHLQPLMLDLLNSVTLDSDLVQITAVQLLQAGAAQFQQQGQQQHLQQVLRVFDLRYPDDLDAAINTALRRASAGTAAVDSSSKKSPGKHKKHQQQLGANALFDFIQHAFTGSRHEVVAVDQQLPGAPQQQHRQQALTLSLAVSAPASQMRLMAIQKLDAICSQPDASESTRQLLHTSLISCLRDDSFAVAAAAAAAAGLAAVPANLQLPALQHLLRRAADRLAAGHHAAADTAATAAGSSSSTKEVMRAAKAALSAAAAVGERAAAETAAEQNSEQQQELLQGVLRQATALLLEYVLADKRSKKLSTAAATVCCSCKWHPLLQLLASSPAVAAALQQDSAAADTPLAGNADSKRRKKSTPGAAAAAGQSAPIDAGQHAGAVAVNRATVQALAEGLTAPGGAAVLTECAALASMCGPRCLHLLQLGLVKAVSAAAVGRDSATTATAVPHTPSGRSRGRGKQQQISSHVATSSSGSRAATPAQIAVALLRMLEQQITPAAAVRTNLNSKSESGSSRLVLPNDWASVAAAALDDSSLPTKQHYQQLHCHLPQLQTSILLAGLGSALAAAPVEGLAAGLGPQVQLFARLAAASAAAGKDTLLPQLQLLVTKSRSSSQHHLQFLADIYGLPSGICSPTVQVAALRIVTVLEANSPSAVAAAAQLGGSSWFVQLLSAVNSSSKLVREAAVDALLALPTSAAAATLDSFSCGDLSDLVSALQQHEALLRGSAGALTPLLASAVAASSMNVDTAAAAAAAGGGSLGRSSRSKANGSKTPAKDAAGSSAAGVAAAATTASLQLPGHCCQALLQLLLTVLPALHNESQLEAAGLTVTVLAAAGGVTAVDKAVAAQDLLQQLMQGLLDSSKVPAGTHADEREVGAVWVQLAAMRGDATAVAEAAVQLQQQRAAVAVALLQFFTPEAVQSKVAADAVAASYITLLQLPFAAPAAIAGAADAGSSKLSDTQLAAVAPVRGAALQQLDAALFAVLLPEQQQAAFAAALQTHSADGDSDCRAAARSALEQLPVSADMLLRLLNRVTGSSNQTRPSLQQQQQQQSKAKRTRRTSSQAGGVSQQQEEAIPADSAAAAAAAAAAGGDGSLTAVVSAADMDAAVAALELLQWKDGVQDKQQLLQPLQEMIKVTLPLMGSMAESYPGEEDSDTAAAAITSDTFPGPAAAAVSPSVVGYAIQLALSTLESLVREYGMFAGGVDPALALKCAGAAADGSVRNAALLLLAVLAELAPGDMLEHVIQAMSVIHQSSALSDDSHSQAVASSVVSSLVPAWLSAGRDSGELWGCLIAALPGLPATRRLRLLEALLRALPQESGLSVGLLLMMQRVIASTAPAAAATATPDSSRKIKKGKKTSTTAANEDQPVAAAGVTDESEWLPDLMAALCEKVSVPVRLQAFSHVLSSSLAGPDGSSVPAHHPSPRLAVTFITAHLKARSVLTAARAAAAAHDHSAAAAIQQACQAIMEQALQHLLQLNPTAATAAEATPKNSRKMHKAVRAAAAGVYDLLAALEAVQDCPSYLQALVQMSRHPVESVQRRALKLLSARLLKAQIDLADLQTATEQLQAAVRQQRQQQLAQAGLAICQDLARLLQAQSALTRQLALIAADAGIRQFGSQLPGTVLECLGTVLATAGNADEAAPVRVSALACIASAVTAVGPKLVPLLPQTAAVVLSAAESACKDLQGFDQEQQQRQRQQDGSSNSDEEHDDEIDTVAAGSHGEEVALQLTAALAGLEALAATLGPFLSPYLKQILQLLLHQQVLACSTTGAAAAAARLRAALPAQIPPRLLVEPLVSQWDYAVAAGSTSRVGSPAAAAASASAEPAAALLGLVAALCSLMQPATAVTYHEALLSLLLRALDTRHRWLAASSGQQEQRPAAADAASDAAAAVAGQLDHTGVHVIESAAVKALSALVMKLSESKFKPMFLRLIEWANAGSSSAALDTQALGRAAAFMAVVCMLADKLRAVFVPYFKYFSVMHMKLLVGEGVGSTAVRPKKKHKKAAATAAAAGPNLGLMVSGWLARLRAVRAVHLLALHEPAAGPSAAVQEQQERFDRLLPLVVEQLAEGPSAEVASILADEGADSALDLPGGPVAALGPAGKAAVEAGGSAVLLDSCDIVGTAAVGALIQMAVAGGSDVVWKPLHHAMLMVARGGSTRAKLLALGGVSRLAELLREEYLMLLPEALPFISELVEDGEVAVEGAAQGLIAQLEVLSGEKLEQYLKA